jgi:hypothetical protein
MALLVDRCSAILSSVEALALDTCGTLPRNILRNLLTINKLELWRRGESNPRPKSATARSLHA